MPATVDSIYSWLCEQCPHARLLSKILDAGRGEHIPEGCRTSASCAAFILRQKDWIPTVVTNYCGGGSEAALLDPLAEQHADPESIGRARWYGLWFLDACQYKRIATASATSRTF